MSEPSSAVIPEAVEALSSGGAPVTQSALSGGARQTCPACGQAALEVFFEQHDIPVTSNVSFRSREEAIACPRGDMRLAFCHDCGLIANTAWEQQPLGDEVETSQAASPRFVEYARSLAHDWVDRYGLRGETILEVGCARGEFLQTLVEAGAGHGLGVDPVLAQPDAPGSTDRITYIGDVFRAEHLDRGPSPVRAIVARHTLEHIYGVGAFLGDIRDAIGDRDIVVLFEVPDAERILVEAAFHDIYYEHCAYFSAGSLQRLFRSSGFEVLRLRRTYDEQYLVIEARPSAARPDGEAADDDRQGYRDALWRGTQELRRGYARGVERIERLVAHSTAAGERVAFWGAGSKATAFLTALPNASQVDCVVDINPRKWGTYIAGTGHAVVSPEHLKEVAPGVVVLMNPAYRDEVARLLDELGVTTRLVGPDGEQ